MRGDISVGDVQAMKGLNSSSVMFPAPDSFLRCLRKSFSPLPTVFPAILEEKVFVLLPFSLRAEGTIALH